MKKILLFLTLIITAGYSHAQTYTPPPVIPPYRILTTDSVIVTPANLKKHQSVMIIYFSPDCSHCQHLMNEMKPKLKDFSKIQIVMITFMLPLKASKVFYHDYNLAKYPNIIVGTEGHSYTVQKYYQLATTPYIAFYDKNDKLVKYFDKVPKIDELTALAKKL